MYDFYIWNIMKWLFFVICLLYSISSWGQSYYYNTQQFGLKSTLLGGAVTAGSSDLSMIYYNPAALRYARGKGFDFALFIPSYTVSNYGDKLGSGQNVTERNIDLNPSLFTYKTSIGKFSLVFTLLQKDLWDTEVRHSNTSFNTAGISKKAFSYDYEGDEKWFGVGSSFNITERLSIGISQFWNILSTNYEYGLSSDVQDLSQNKLQEFYTDQFHLNFSSTLSMTTKLGLAFNTDNDKVGLVVSTPYYAPFSNSANLEKATSILDLGRTVMTNTIDFEIDPVIKNGWEIDLGYSRMLPDSSEIWLKMSHHFGVKEYEMFTAKRINLEGLTFTNGLKKVTNFAIGYSKEVSENVHILGSIRTNKNANLPRQNNQRSQSIILLTQDRMHLALGSKIEHRNSSFVIGLDYGFSTNYESPPFENFPSVNLLNLRNTKYSEHSLTLLLTYQFFLDSMGRNISRMIENTRNRKNYPHHQF